MATELQPGTPEYFTQVTAPSRSWQEWAAAGFPPLPPGERPPPPTPIEPDRDAFAYIEELLRFYDLEGLSSWAWDQIVNGSSGEQIIQSMRQQPLWQTRFAAIVQRQQAGLAPISEGELISYERQVRQLMVNAGFPPGFYDQPEDFIDLAVKDLSINELNQRILNQYIRVSQAPTEIRDAFTEWFGVEGDSALAAYFLDPDRTQPYLERAVQMAEIGGTGMRFGIGISQDMASRLASIGVDLGQANQGFAQIHDLSSVFTETVTEDQDLTAEETGVGAIFGTDLSAAEQLRRRRDQRQANFSGATGEPLAGIGEAGRA